MKYLKSLTITALLCAAASTPALASSSAFELAWRSISSVAGREMIATSPHARALVGRLIGRNAGNIDVRTLNFGALRTALLADAETGSMVFARFSRSVTRAQNHPLSRYPAYRERVFTMIGEQDLRLGQVSGSDEIILLESIGVQTWARASARLLQGRQFDDSLIQLTADMEMLLITESNLMVNLSLLGTEIASGRITRECLYWTASELGSWSEDAVVLLQSVRHSVQEMSAGDRVFLTAYLTTVYNRLQAVTSTIRGSLNSPSGPTSIHELFDMTLTENPYRLFSLESGAELGTSVQPVVTNLLQRARRQFQQVATELRAANRELTPQAER